MHIEDRLERREFFRRTGLTLAASSFAIAGLESSALFSFGNGTAAETRKVLVTYASRAGSTAEVAEEIGRILNGGGIPAEVLPVGRVADMSRYNAAVIGSAVRMGSWLPEATRLVEKNQAVFAGMPTALFTVCMTMQKDTAETRGVVEGYMKPILQKVRPVSIGLFGGKMDYSRLGFMDRLIVSKLKKVPEGDHRDWQAIRKWAGNCVPSSRTSSHAQAADSGEPQGGAPEVHPRVQA